MKLLLAGMRQKIVCIEKGRLVCAFERAFHDLALFLEVESEINPDSQHEPSGLASSRKELVRIETAVCAGDVSVEKLDSARKEHVEMLRAAIDDVQQKVPRLKDALSKAHEFAQNVLASG